MVTKLKKSKLFFSLTALIVVSLLSAVVFGFPEIKDLRHMESGYFYLLISLAMVATFLSIFEVLFFKFEKTKIFSELSVIVPAFWAIFYASKNNFYDKLYGVSFDGESNTAYKILVTILISYLPYLFFIIGLQNIFQKKFIKNSLTNRIKKSFFAEKKLKKIVIAEEICFSIIIVVFMFSFKQYIAAIFTLVFSVFLISFTVSKKSLVSQLESLDKTLDCILNNDKIQSSSISSDALLYDTEIKLLKISERAEESLNLAMKSERIKVELITNVSHDLKTPLTAIIGYTERLNSFDLPEESKKYVEKLNFKLKYFSELLSDIFELSKASTGNLKANKELIDIRKLVEQTVAEFFDEIVSAKLEVIIDCKNKEILSELDGMQIHRVLQNLLDNAIKYSLPTTRIYVMIKTSSENCNIEIINTSSYRMDFSTEEIMERFARGDKSRMSCGSGLGLNIAKTYTQINDGDMSIKITGDQFSVLLAYPILKVN